MLSLTTTIILSITTFISFTIVSVVLVKNVAKIKHIDEDVNSKIQRQSAVNNLQEKSVKNLVDSVNYNDKVASRENTRLNRYIKNVELDTNDKMKNVDTELYKFKQVTDSNFEIVDENIRKGDKDNSEKIDLLNTRISEVDIKYKNRTDYEHDYTNKEIQKVYAHENSNHVAMSTYLNSNLNILYSRTSNNLQKINKNKTDIAELDSTLRSVKDDYIGKLEFEELSKDLSSNVGTVIDYGIKFKDVERDISTLRDRKLNKDVYYSHIRDFDDVNDRVVNLENSTDLYYTKDSFNNFRDKDFRSVIDNVNYLQSVQDGRLAEINTLVDDKIAAENLNDNFNKKLNVKNLNKGVFDLIENPNSDTYRELSGTNHLHEMNNKITALHDNLGDPTRKAMYIYLNQNDDVREKLERTDSNFQELGILKNDHKNLSDDFYRYIDSDSKRHDQLMNNLENLGKAKQKETSDAVSTVRKDMNAKMETLITQKISDNNKNYYDTNDFHQMVGYDQSELNKNNLRTAFISDIKDYLQLRKDDFKGKDAKEVNSIQLNESGQDKYELRFNFTEGNPITTQFDKPLDGVQGIDGQPGVYGNYIDNITIDNCDTLKNSTGEPGKCLKFNEIKFNENSRITPATIQPREIESDLKGEPGKDGTFDYNGSMGKLKIEVCDDPEGPNSDGSLKKTICLKGYNEASTAANKFDTISHISTKGDGNIDSLFYTTNQYSTATGTHFHDAAADDTTITR